MSETPSPFGGADDEPQTFVGPDGLTLKISTATLAALGNADVLLLDTEQVRTALGGISPSTLTRLRRDPDNPLRSVQLGIAGSQKARVMFVPSDVKEFIDSLPRA